MKKIQYLFSHIIPTLSAIIIAAQIHFAYSYENTTSYGPPLLRLQSHLEDRFYNRNHPKLRVSDVNLFSSEKLIEFYQQRSFKLAWITADANWSNANILIDTLYNAKVQGLTNSRYHYDDILKLLATETPLGSDIYFDVLIDLEILLTDAIFQYLQHKTHGQLSKKSFKAKWYADDSSIDLISLVNNALDKNSLSQLIDSLAPNYVAYHQLQQALTYYLKIQQNGEWPAIEFPSQLGDQGDHVEKLMQRLILSGDLNPTAVDENKWFNDVIEEAVKHFQTRHGLDVTGQVDETTLAELNLPIEKRIQQILINLERWRWLPEDLGKQFVMVNIPGFELNYVKNNKTKLTSKVIVGRTYRRTPVFNETMKYIVVNPSWNVPRRLARADVLPKIIKDSSYLKKKGFVVLSRKDASKIDPATIDWKKYDKESFPYQLRQRPGSINALGKVKLMFPNRYNVYLHDTPKHHLFNKQQRTFSSGCIRVEKADELATLIIEEHPDWNTESAAALFQSSRQKVINLLDPIPVHILYWTTWVDSHNKIHFRKDIYRRDQALLEALLKK